MSSSTFATSAQVDLNASECPTSPIPSAAIDATPSKESRKWRKKKQWVIEQDGDEDEDVFYEYYYSFNLEDKSKKQTLTKSAQKKTPKAKSKSSDIDTLTTVIKEKPKKKGIISLSLIFLQLNVMLKHNSRCATSCQ